MAAPIEVHASWARGKVDTYFLLPCGQFMGIMNEPKRALLKSTCTTIDDSIEFLSCRNRGKPKWSICALSRQKFADIPKNTVFDCEFILFIGVHYDRDSRCLIMNHLKWKGDIFPYRSIKDAMRALPDALSFIKTFFHQDVSQIPVREGHWRHLNQVSGPALSCWRWKPTFASRNGDIFHCQSRRPDLWWHHWLTKSDKALRGKLIVAPSSCPPTLKGFQLEKCPARKSFLFGINHVLQRKKFKTLVVYSRKTERDQYIGQDTKWIPLPNRRHGFHEFVVLSTEERSKVDQLVMKAGGWMNDSDFRKVIDNIISTSRGEIVSLPCLECCAHDFGGPTFNYINVVVDQECDPSELGARPISEGCWVLTCDSNMLDIDVPGIGKTRMGCVVGRFSVHEKEVSLTEEHKMVLCETYPLSGLRRYRTKHDGSFFMCARRQSCMSNSNMAEVNDRSQNFYFDEKQMNTSLLNVSCPIINNLSDQAIRARDVCGQISMGIVKRAAYSLKKKNIRSAQLCPHIIFTKPKFCKEFDCVVTYASSEHLDNDETTPELSEASSDYVKNSGCRKLIDYYLKMDELFADRVLVKVSKTNTSRRKFQLPTTCIWSPSSDLNYQNDVEHIQLFVIPTAGVCWDVSSTTMYRYRHQVTGTFLGGLVSHLTSCSLWKRESDGFVTTLCPDEHMTTIAWGSNSTKKRDEADENDEMKTNEE